MSEAREKFEKFELPAIELKAHQDSGNSITLHELKELIRHGYRAGLEEAASIKRSAQLIKDAIRQRIDHEPNP